MYEGSAARRMDAYEGAYAPRGMQSAFGVVEGAGLDAQVRAGVSAHFVGILKLVGIALVALSVLSFARVGIFTATTGILMENNSMRTELKDARATRDELRIERSVLSSSSRIERIATQSYGMVLAESSESMTAGAAAAAAAEAEAQAASAESANTEVTGVDSAQNEQVEDAIQADAEAQQAAAQEQAAEISAALEEATMTQGDGSTAGSNAVDVDSL